MNRLAGVAYLSVGGQSYAVDKTSYDVSNIERSTLTGQDGVHGFQEKPKPGRIKATLRDTAGVDWRAINNMTNETVVLELANGKTVVGRNCWTVGQGDVDTENAEGEITFEGPSVQEV